MRDAISLFITTLSLLTTLPDSQQARSAPTAPERWRVLAGRTIYFAHQSVGDDIVAGIEDLDARFALGIRIVETNRPDAVASPAFVHFHSGKNGDPASKNRDLLRTLQLRRAPSSPGDAERAIVVLKYCYTDIEFNTDVQRVYEAYRATLATVRQRHPAVAIVQSTVALTTVEPPFKAAIKRLLGRSTRHEGAVARQRYNALVRAGIGKNDHLFDIAAVESRSGDGRVASFERDGLRVEVLSAANARDSGHLNQSGRIAAAAEFLNTLSRAAEASE